MPAIIDEKTFNAVQAFLQSRAPKRVPPRVVNGPTFLAGIASCGHCGAALIQNTGKGGAYRYYCCSRRLKEGRLACTGVRMRMDKLDGIVLAEVTKRVLQPKRLGTMLDAYVRTELERDDRNREDMRQFRQDYKEAEAGIARLLELVEKGLLDAEDSRSRERLVALRFRRDERTRELSDLQKRLALTEPAITTEKVARLAVLLREKRHEGPSELRQAYARLLLREVTVDGQEIRIRGSKAMLARAASEGLSATAPSVLSIVREWRAGEDSNPRPPDS